MMSRVSVMKFRSLPRHELKIQFAYTISRFLNYIWSTQVPLEHAEIKSAAAALLRTWRPMGPFPSFAVIYCLLTGLSFVYRHFTFGFLSLFWVFPWQLKFHFTRLLVITLERYIGQIAALWNKSRRKKQKRNKGANHWNNHKLFYSKLFPLPSRIE